MSIKRKLILPVILLAALLTAIVLGICIFIFNSFMQTENEQTVADASNAALAQFDDRLALAGQAATRIAFDPQFRDTVAAGDSEGAKAAAEGLLAESGADLCLVTDTEGNVMVQSFEGEEDLASFPTVQAALSEEQSTAVSSGSVVQMALCGGSPVYDDEDRFVGTVTTGYRLDTDAYVDSLKEITGLQATVFLGDTRIATTVLNEEGQRAVGTQAAPEVAAQVLGGQVYTGTAQVVGESYFVSYTPITSGSEVVGMLFVGLPTSAQMQAMQGFVLISAIAAVIMLALLVVIVLRIVSKISRSIGQMVHAADSLAVGDLDVNLDIRTNDETRQLADAFGRMVQSNREQAEVLRLIAEGDYSMQVPVRSENDLMSLSLNNMLDSTNQMLQEIRTASDQVASGSAQIADGASALATGSTQQAATVQEFSATLAELQQQAEQSSEMAETTKRETSQAGVLMQQSLAHMEQVTSAMQSIEASSEDIAKVIKVIDDIAFQTNILALNAAVEAARAGQHGKGFAVVADEVRNLASKSAAAAKETAGLIQTSVENVKNGTGIVAETAESLGKVGEIAQKNAADMQTLNTLSSQQSASINEINEGIGQISQVVQSNSATAQQSAASAEEMSAQSAMLNRIVSRFQLRGEENALPSAERAALPAAKQ
ncbi:methyl-accepting chemotaxis protein [Ruminococcaceae bacterium OttesenSCG-928-I18]|nr:methyl-accepting chemotaxis protein [Ruminococcaceae bacterium OttesenSCG-928-I18]